MSKHFRDAPRIGAVGAQSEPEQVTCRRGNNPFGHPAGCDCRRASLEVPVAEVVEFPASRHNALFDPPEAA